jgi:hypothetical protein
MNTAAWPAHGHFMIWHGAGDGRVNVINIKLPSPSDARYQRAVSWICEVLEQRTNQSKQFWHLRYQVQEIQSPFREQLQKDISARLTALHCLGRFDAKAIPQIKVRQVVKELLKRISKVKNDRHRLRMRSPRLTRRLRGTICAYRWWLVRVSRELNVLDDGSRAYGFRNRAYCSGASPRQVGGR